LIMDNSIYYFIIISNFSFIRRQGHHNSLYANSMGPVVEMKQTLRVVTARDLFASSVVLLRPPYNTVRVKADGTFSLTSLFERRGTERAKCLA